jgi:6-pyruvoyltetrahydropterin/6-carboxytetrahydropterin synthase
MIEVTRRYRFAASHRLHTNRLNVEENRELYGKCNNPFGHGHNYEVAVTIRGPVHPTTGRAVDPRLLDALIRTQVLEVFDHRNLNAEIPRFLEEVPTSENLALEIDRRLRAAWSGIFPGTWPRLEKIRIAETERNIFEVSEGHETYQSRG